MLSSTRKPGRRRGTRFSEDRRRRAIGRGGPALIRFRRNQEYMAREVVILVLWVGLTILLTSLCATLWRVSSLHLLERSAFIRLALPGLALVAGLGSAFRARRSMREFLDIRHEQAELATMLRDPEQDATAGDGAGKP